MAHYEAIIVNLDTFTLKRINDVRYLPNTNIVEFYSLNNTLCFKADIKPPNVLDVRKEILCRVKLEQKMRFANLGNESV